jgi:hypothetical protein
MSMHGRGDFQWPAFIPYQFRHSSNEYLRNLTCKFNHKHERCISHLQYLIYFMYCFKPNVIDYHYSLHGRDDFQCHQFSVGMLGLCIFVTIEYISLSRYISFSHIFYQIF